MTRRRRPHRSLPRRLFDRTAQKLWQGLRLAGRALLGVAFFTIGFCEGAISEMRMILRENRR